MITAFHTAKGSLIELAVLKAHGVENDFYKSETVVGTKIVLGREQSKSAPLWKSVSSNGKTYICFSRSSLQKLEDCLRNVKITHKMCIPRGLDFAVERSAGFTPTENQEVVLKKLSEIFTEQNAKSNSAKAWVVMNTGTGKSYLGAALIALIKKRAIIVVPGMAAEKEWLKSLALLESSETVIGQYNGKVKKQGSVMIMTKGSFNKPEYFGVPAKAWFADFGLIIYDEVHSYCTDGCRDLFYQSFPYSLGLTATPDENTWGFDRIFQSHLLNGIVAQELPGFNSEAVIWKGILHAIHYTSEQQYTQSITSESGILQAGEMIKAFCRDPHRLKLLDSLLTSVLKSNRNAFIFCAHRETAEQLLQHVSAYCSDSMLLIGGAKTQDFENTVNAKIIITTYSFGWQSISVPHMDTLIFYTPQKAKMKQIFGRIARISGDTTRERIIYDIVDNHSFTKKQALNRKTRISELCELKIAPVKRIKFSEL